MLSNKYIKLLCYILIIIIDIAAIVLLIMGISKIAEDDSTGTLFLLMGVIMPILVSVSVYPIFALARIDSNTSDINQKFEYLLDVLTKKADLNEEIEDDEDDFTAEDLPNDSIDEDVDCQDDVLPIDLIYYINKKYDIGLLIDDSIEEIKKKIERIDSKKNTLVITFKARIALAKDIKEIISLIKMHKVINE